VRKRNQEIERSGLTSKRLPGSDKELGKYKVRACNEDELLLVALKFIYERKWLQQPIIPLLLNQ